VAGEINFDQTIVTRDNMRAEKKALEESSSENAIPDAKEHNDSSKSSYRNQCTLLVAAKKLAEANANNPDFGYKNFIPLKSGSGKRTSTFLARKGVNELFSLDSAQASSLIPRIRLFKSFPLENPEDLTNTRDVEFKFRSHFSDFSFNYNTLTLSNNLQEDDITLGVPKDVGLKSFTITVEGGDFTTRNLIQAELTIVMRSLEDLLDHCNYEIHDGKEYKVRYIDLASLPLNGAELWKFDPYYYTIKAVIGWAKPSGDVLTRTLWENIDGFTTTYALNVIDHEINMNENGQVELKVTYKGTADALMLSDRTNILSNPEIRQLELDSIEIKKKELTSTKEKIEVEGELSKQYGQERWEKVEKNLGDTTLEEIEGDMDVGYISAGSRYTDNHYKSAIELARDQKKRIAKNREKYVEDNGDLLGSDLFEKKETIDKHLEEVQQERSNVLNKLRISKNKRYQDIIQGMLERGRVFYVDIPKHDIEFIHSVLEVNNLSFGMFDNFVRGLETTDVATLSRNELQESAAARFPFQNIKIVSSDLPFDSVVTLFGTANLQKEVDGLSMSDEQDEQAIHKLGQKTIAERTHGFFKGEGVDNVLEDVREIDDFFEGDNPEYTRNTFVFLGDIIEEALNPLYSIETPFPFIKNMTILLGDIQLFSGDRKFSINIADLPISFELFFEWFLNKIVKPQRNKYHLREFLSDIVAEIVPAAIKSQCFENRMFRLNQIDVSTFTLQTKNGENPIANLVQTPHQNLNRRLDLERRDVIDFFQQSYLASFKTDKTDFTYVLLNSGQVNDGNFNGDPIEDFEQGIYHFWIGNSRGLLKTIKFKNNTLAHVREANLQKVDSKQLDIIAKYYDVEMTMIGNSLFLTGQLIYINPTLFGYGDPANVNSIAYKLGIGGYYLITRVESEFTNGSFETVIDAKWQSFVKENGDEGEAGGRKVNAFDIAPDIEVVLPKKEEYHSSLENVVNTIKKRLEEDGD